MFWFHTATSADMVALSETLLVILAKILAGTLSAILVLHHTPWHTHLSDHSQVCALQSSPPGWSLTSDKAGSADRNLQPISNALSPLIEDTLHNARTGEAGTEDEENAAQGDSDRVRIFEIGSLPYTHIRSFARRWPRIHWTGSGRDAEEVK